MSYPPGNQRGIDKAYNKSNPNCITKRSYEVEAFWQGFGPRNHYKGFNVVQDMTAVEKIPIQCVYNPGHHIDFTVC